MAHKYNVGIAVCFGGGGIVAANSLLLWSAMPPPLVIKLDLAPHGPWPFPNCHHDCGWEACSRVLEQRKAKSLLFLSFFLFFAITDTLSRPK